MSDKNENNDPISLRIPPDLLAAIDARAAEENRNRSNMIITLLKKELQED